MDYRIKMEPIIVTALTEEEALQKFKELLEEEDSWNELFKAYSRIDHGDEYFYDILSGKVNPPPPDMQYKMLKCLDLDEKQRNEFLNLAAKGRNEIPADVARLISNHPEKIDLIRQKLAEIFTTQ